MRNFLILNWVPSHCGITGNEFADHSAKNAIRQVLFYTDNLNWIDLARQIDGNYMRIDRVETFNSTSFWYKTVNTERISIYDYLGEYTSKFYRLESIKLLRLRIGHTKISHGFLFNANLTLFAIVLT